MFIIWRPSTVGWVDVGTIAHQYGRDFLDFMKSVQKDRTKDCVSKTNLGFTVPKSDG
jgi:hypothetical protein